MNVSLIPIHANAQIVRVDNDYMLFSYGSYIMTITNDVVSKVSNLWDYSTTTSKHLNKFLREMGRADLAEMGREEKWKYFKSKGLI